MGKEQNEKYYSKIYVSGGANNAYHQHYSKTLYYNTFIEAIEYIKNNNIDVIFDIGCGNGQFAHCIKDNIRDILYFGYDFSTIAIKYAKNKNLGENFIFKCENMMNFNLNLDMEPFKNKNICIITMEFLEHVSWDLDFLSGLNQGTKIFFSVPNFDCEGHVRYFKNMDEVINRYENIIKIINKKENIIQKTNKHYLIEGITK